MASGSSSTDEAYSASFDVFLNFNGEDTRYPFTRRLYHMLFQTGCYTFMDVEAFNRGEEVIKASRASIVVLSENYATSTWCLDELVLILKQRRECNHFVLPVFYHVDPTDVRNQTGTFDIKAKSYLKSWTDDKVRQWREALREVAQLKGLVANGSTPETSFLKEIVDKMCNELASKDLGTVGRINHDSQLEIYDKQYKSRDDTVGDIISALDEIKIDESALSWRMDFATRQGEKLSSSISAHQFRIFSLTEIKSATCDFAGELIIGKGGFGTVYKGQISGHLVAIKRLDPMSSQGEVEFRAEIDALCKLRHCHLVSLIGYCDDNKEMVLVYEYMPNGTLYDHLHKAHTPLSWVTRLKIAIGAARGMDYLHTGVGTQYGIIHRDVKSTNILLDANWDAMVSDFGMSRTGPTSQSVSYVRSRVKGTFGYLDPFYFNTGKLTRNTDVYAFGVVLFELLSGRPAVDPHKDDDECSLVTWAKVRVKQRKFDELVDPNIKGTISTKCLRQFAQMADRCVHDVMKERPTMSDLVASLRSLLELQEKSNSAVESSGIMGLPWKIHKYFGSSTKPNSGQSGTRLQINDDKKQHRDE